VVVFIVVLFGKILFSAPPISGFKFENYPKDHVSKRDILKRKFKIERGVISFTPTKGVINLAVILVNFQDEKIENVKNFEAIFSSFTSYYKEVSYNQLNINVYFVDSSTPSGKTYLTGTETPFTASRIMAYYGNDGNSNTESEERFEELASEIILQTNIYSTEFDAIMIAHAGYGEESTGIDNDLWSLFLNFQNSYHGFSDATFVPEKETSGMSPLGVICHEFGHQLGLVDLYDTYTNLYENNSVCRIWALMDSGCWNDGGRTPAHIMSFNKWYLGWLNPIKITKDSTKVLHKYEISSGTIPLVYKIPINSSPFPEKEFLLLSYRKKEGFDKGLDKYSFSDGWKADQEEGIIIWHIDLNKMGLDENFNIIKGGNCESNTINDDPDHRSIIFKGRGAFIEGETFCGGSYYNETDTSTIIITNFTKSSDSNYVSFTVDTISIEEFFVIKKAINYPNPAHKYTTIQLTCSRPYPEDLKIKIYTIKGIPVKEISKNDLLYLEKYTADYNVVYEYTWNLRDENGNNVPSGVYFYVIRTGNEKIVRKIAVVR